MAGSRREFYLQNLLDAVNGDTATYPDLVAGTREEKYFQNMIDAASGNDLTYPNLVPVWSNPEGWYEKLVLALQNGGGGGGGLDYETGSYIPNADIAQPVINFANPHTNSPIYIFIVDADHDFSTVSADSILGVAMINAKGTFGFPIQTGNSDYICGKMRILSRTSAGSTSTYMNLISDLDVQAVMSSSSFTPGSSAKYFRANKTYEWIAVWGPTV